MNNDTTGEINFYSHTKDGSFPWMDANPKLGWTASNYVQIPARVNIYDLRGRQDNFKLDINGFELLKYDGQIHNVFDDNSEAQRCYYEDIIGVLKKRLGASRVIIFNHTIRFRGPTLSADQCDNTHKNPVFYPHVDSDPHAAHAKVKEVLGEEEAEKVFKNRFQIINFWRPLGPNPITHTPLTICDYQSLDLGNDIHLSETRGSVSTVSIYIISRNSEDAQKWYYVSDMRSDEMLMFKIFDSNRDSAQFGAHTAFINDSAPANHLDQCSIEVRCIVLYDQQ